MTDGMGVHICQNKDTERPPFRCLTENLQNSFEKSFPFRSNKSQKKSMWRTPKGKLVRSSVTFKTNCVPFFQNKSTVSSCKQSEKRIHGSKSNLLPIQEWRPAVVWGTKMKARVGPMHFYLMFSFFSRFYLTDSDGWHSLWSHVFSGRPWIVFPSKDKKSGCHLQGDHSQSATWYFEAHFWTFTSQRSPASGGFRAHAHDVGVHLAENGQLGWRTPEGSVGSVLLWFVQSS